MHSWLVIVALCLVPETIDVPIPNDDRLSITLFAAEPELVTPTGIAVDAQGRVLVVESHTHFPPEGYTGPQADRIRMGIDANHDGKAERITTFFEGTKFTMNIAVDSKGWVWVATRGELFRLRDADNDGRADERVPIAKLETSGDYPHNGLSGFAFDQAGRVYFGLGENLGATYKLVGSDGVSLAGGGEGGSIYRCHADGRGLERVATGFWNPFHLCFDVYDRLFAVDNDPDSRPPCRLLHIVPGGDYGYRFRNGRKGLHPFTAWNGELPGTLPMVAGTGEAPSGIVAYESDGLPSDYRGELLVTSWGDHRLERNRPAPNGASFTSRPVPFVSGGENFRPVGIAVAPDGALYVSDWVDKSYTLHGKGRVWCIRAKARANATRPSDPSKGALSADRRVRETAARTLAAKRDGRKLLAKLAKRTGDPRIRASAIAALVQAGEKKAVAQVVATLPDGELKELVVRLSPSDWNLDKSMGAIKSKYPPLAAEGLRRVRNEDAAEMPLEFLEALDAFIQQAALVGLRQSRSLPDLLALVDDANPRMRLAALLLLRQNQDAAARAALPKLLADSDPLVRSSAVQWVGEERLAEFQAQVEGQLARAGTRQLFEGCLAALELLDRAAHPEIPPPEPGDEFAGEDYVVRLLAQPETPAAVRRRALSMLRPDHPALTAELLDELLACGDSEIEKEAVRTLGQGVLPERFERLSAIAADPNETADLRGEAIVGLASEVPRNQTLLMSLAHEMSHDVRHEALRALRGASLDANELDRLREFANGCDECRDLVERIAESPDDTVPTSQHDIEAFLAQSNQPGEAAVGERIFFHPLASGCFRCHQIDGRGGAAGPDLTQLGPLRDPRRLIESILLPDKEIAPRFVSWSIEKTDGTVIVGMLVSKQADGSETFVTSEGKTETLKPDEIDRRQPNPHSIMPSNVARSLTPRELNDLVAYLLAPR